ncbi:enoyl-CoA hydratase/isomerase family protein [Shouchella patagoniensis]|uniref:enoyl-CoA hydratase/isomerase family protein n=1 Tax=Shouchella patagoniensis TaxID=228576 RepID=UPI00099582FA|nr:enoyl-CoA hydratase/isomerase family protein [Shouchella patagoniensis]
MSTNLQFKTTESGVGVLTLAREQALNSLSQDMISSMLQLLQQWENDENVQIVLLEGAGEKAFCAGGDIKALYQARDQKNGFEQAKKFFQEEYELDLFIATYPKPIIVLMDGIVMGGGVGLAQGASHRIVTEKTKWSMPEMNISFFPDVGACYFLSQTPGGYTGRYAALTAAVLKGEDAISMACADYFIPSHSLPVLREQLLETDWRSGHENVHQAAHLFLQPFIEEPPKSELALLQNKINEHFSHKTIESILDSLEKKDDSFAQETAKMMRSKSPLALKVTLAHLKQSQTSTLEETYETDIILAMHFLQCDDFYEGVRSVLIEKTRTPNYQYKAIEDVPDELALSFFREI